MPGHNQTASRTLRIAVPPGIGDAVWALMKAPGLLREAKASSLDITICGDPSRESKPFIERFRFVDSVRYSDYRCLPPDDRFTAEGIGNWVPTCRRWMGEFDWLLQANSWLEGGHRLESWLPGIATEWQIAKQFHFDDEELQFGRELEERLGPYCVFFLGPERGNTVAGHNRGSLWKPAEWQRLAQLCRDLGLAIVVVGAERDRSYFDHHVGELLGECHDGIGKWHIARTFAVIRRARFMISYQSGLGIFAVYLGVPAGVFWRPYGDSLLAENRLTYREEMAAAWAPTEALASGRYLPLIYTRCSPESIIDHATCHAWHLEDRNT